MTAWGERWDPFSFSPMWGRPSELYGARVMMAPASAALLAVGFAAAAFGAGFVMGYALGRGEPLGVSGGEVVDGEWRRV